MSKAAWWSCFVAAGIVGASCEPSKPSAETAEEQEKSPVASEPQSPPSSESEPLAAKDSGEEKTSTPSTAGPAKPESEPLAGNEPEDATPTAPTEAEPPKEESRPTTAVPEEKPATEAPAVAPVKTGIVRGAVTFSGQPFPGEEAAREGEKRGLKDAVVMILAKGSGGESVGREIMIVESKGCSFTPRVTAIQKGAPLRIMNTGTEPHALRLEALRNQAQDGTLKAGESKEFALDRPEAIALSCSLHSGEKSWIVVSESPFYTVTGADGAYVIAGVPEGEHELRIWRAGLDERTAPVRVEAGKDAVLDYDLSSSP